MFKLNLFKISQADRNNFCEEIIDSSAPRSDFYLLVILSSLVVSLGMIRDNIILVIGGMMITPILSPLMAISLGIIILNLKVIIRSLRVFFTSFSLGLIVAAMVEFFSNVDLETISIIKILEPSWYTFTVALVAGIAASYTWAKPNLNSNLPAIAITVTLIPPLAAIGLAFGSGNWVIAFDSFLVLLINIAGIILASLVVFIFMQFYKSKKKILAEVKEEEKEMNK